MGFRWNFDRIERDYRDACHREGLRPRRLIRPHRARLRAVPAVAAAPLPPDVFHAVVDALATALVADVETRVSIT